MLAIQDSAWTQVQAVTSANPSFLAVHPSQRFLYAINEIDTYQGLPTGTAEAYAIDERSGRLTLINRQPLSLSGVIPAHLAVSPDGRALVVAPVWRRRLQRAADRCRRQARQGIEH